MRLLWLVYFVSHLKLKDDTLFKLSTRPLVCSRINGRLSEEL